MYLYKDRRYIDEEAARAAGFSKIAGIDESGRGTGFAEVVVCCCMLPINHGIVGIRDSKIIRPAGREKLYTEILEKALSISIALATHREIDEINIYQATKKCVYMSISNMKIRPDFVFVDGLFDLDTLSIPWIAVPGGDGAQIYTHEHPKKVQIGHHYENIAAASIVAKVYRDRLMEEYDKRWPQYGFKAHKGYLTEEHREALRKYGPCPLHRLTFRGVLQPSLTP
jgi:ribonuclease HII